jgi:XTP/dITP diphosphohydrolase
MQKIVLASNNAGKLREFSAMLSPLGFELVPQAELGVSEAEEPHHTFVENALAKARHASAASGLPALADDSGICAPALAGAPGVHSARYAGEPKSDARNNAKLITEMAKQTDVRVFYFCALVYVRHASDPTPVIATADWWGQLSAMPQGSGGFGYDPHFWLPDRGMTAAELAPEQKNKISHRGRALAQLIDQLRRSLV